METEPQSTGSATPAPDAPTPDTEAEVEAAFEEIEVDAPLVGIIMGSKNDKPKMQPAGKVLHEHGISYEVRVLSAHRQPDETADYCENARMRGLKVIIAGAGMSAALPGLRRIEERPPGDRRPDPRQVAGRSRRPALRGPDASRASRSPAWRSTAPRTPAFWQSRIHQSL